MKAEKVSPVVSSLLEALREVPDPRVNRTLFHRLENVLFMALLGVLSGAEGWDDLALFARTHENLFCRFLEMPKGTPSADTFRRVFESLDPEAFRRAFGAWLRPILQNLEGERIALDGKTLRGALAHSRKQPGAFHLMHAWATERRLLLAQKATAGAGCEPQAAIEMLETLSIEGATITADAGNCTKGVAGAAQKAGADYLLALKGNRSALHTLAKGAFAKRRDNGYRGVSSFDTKESSHGRAEYRVVRAIPLGAMKESSAATGWPGLRSLVQVERIRYADELSVSRCYNITSHKASARTLANMIRDHWKIENELHHCLDVTFGEDRRGIRQKNAAQNFALLSRYAVGILKRDPMKMSVAMKKRKAAWDQSYFLEVLANGFPEI